MSATTRPTDALPSRFAGLTPRERLVMVFLTTRGATAREIADALDLTGAAARNAVSSLRRKLAVPRYQDLPSFVADHPVLADALNTLR